MATPSIITVLKQDHQTVAALLAKATATRNGRRRAALYDQIKDALTRHTAFEEEHLYPVLAQKARSKDMAFEAWEEHGVVKHLLKDLGRTDVDDDHWKAKMTVLTENVRHHVAEEEAKGGLFAQLRQALDARTLTDLATDYLAMEA